MTDATEAADTPAAPETEVKETAPVEQQSTEQAEPSKEEPTEEPAASEPGDDSADEAPKKKHKGGFQKRIDELTTARIHAEMRAQQLQRELESERQKKATVSPDEPGPEPKLENYTQVDVFLKDHVEWAKKVGALEAKQQIQKETEEQQKKREAEAKEQEAIAIRAAVATRAAAARQKYPDFDAVVRPLSPIIDSHPTLNDYVGREELGMEMAYHLARNPTILDEISRMPERQAARELLKLEAKLTAPAPAKPVTKAPDPIKPVGANEKVQKPLGELSMEEYSRIRREQRRKAKG